MTRISLLGAYPASFTRPVTRCACLTAIPARYGVIFNLLSSTTWAEPSKQHRHHTLASIPQLLSASSSTALPVTTPHKRPAPPLRPHFLLPTWSNRPWADPELPSAVDPRFLGGQDYARFAVLTPRNWLLRKEFRPALFRRVLGSAWIRVKRLGSYGW